MELLKFADYETYIEAQRKTVARRGIGPYFTWHEIQRISEHVKRECVVPTRVVCHGARNGLECDEFAKNFPGVEAIGTDLFPHSGRSANYSGESEVIACDFSEPKDEWLGAFDIVYSNSLDHSRDPVKTLNVWLDQLKPNGFLFLQWGKNHSSGNAKGGDCFAADFWEMCDLLNSVGKLTGLIYCNIDKARNILQRRATETTVFVVQKKD